MPVRGFLVILVIVAAGVAGWYFALGGDRLKPNPPTVSGGITGATKPVEAPPPPIDPNLPTFDIVRIDSTGQAVVSGHSIAGAKITLRANAKQIGEATANNRGEWVIVVPRPLVVGSQEMTVSASDSNGQTFAAIQTVIVDVTRQGKTPLAVLEIPGRASRLFQGSDEAGALAVALVDYHASGAVLISGRAEPWAKSRLYLDNEPLGVAAADSHGVWVLKLDGIAPGAYTMRVDQLGPKGSVAARIEVPFERVNPPLIAEAMLGLKQLAVQPVNDQWRIARRLTGSGYQYTVIYQANQGQIRDPNLVYPGQIFEAPEASAQE